MLRVVSLFSGIGGFEQGIEMAVGKENYEVVFSSEIDRFASVGYKALYGHTPNGDIRQVDEHDIPDHDLLVAGFPCQQFSIAGQRLGFKDETKGTLFFEIARILEAKKPRYILLENVKGLVNHDKGKTFEIIKGRLRDLGYTIHYKILNSKGFGLAQNRERIFIVGKYNHPEFSYVFPEEKSVSVKIKDILEDFVEDNYFASEEYHQRFVHKEKHNDIIQKGYIDNPYKDKDKYCVDSDEGIARCLTVGNARDIKIMTKKKYILSDYAQGKIKERLGDKEGTVYNYYNDIVYDDYTGTLTTCTGSWTGKTGFVVLEEDCIRKITPLECLRLQGFKEETYQTLRNAGISNTQIYKQSGNAVSPPVIKAIIENLIR